LADDFRLILSALSGSLTTTPAEEGFLTKSSSAMVATCLLEPETRVEFDLGKIESNKKIIKIIKNIMLITFSKNGTQKK